MSTESIPTAAALDRIDTLAKCYHDARKLVAERVSFFQKEQAALRVRRVPGIKSALEEAAGYQAKLAAAIEEHKDLFVKPRTMTLHGIKLGFQKGKGKTIWPPVEKLLALIKRTFAPATAERLIEKTEQPNKAAILQLPTQELKKLGIEVEGTGDFVFVKAVDDEVDKLVAKILKEGEVAEAEAS